MVTHITIGIDPSINSSGVCIIFHHNDEENEEKYFIIKPNKLTKTEREAVLNIDNFEYVLYQKEDLKQFKEINHIQEQHKTQNIINAAQKIEDIIYNQTKDWNVPVIIVQEGISYGSSIRTKSVFDLAGLNYIIRDKLFNKAKYTMYICPPSNIKKYATGNGNCKKEMIIEMFKTIHKDINIPKIDDIADAYFMACMAHTFWLNTSS